MNTLFVKHLCYQQAVSGTLVHYKKMSSYKNGTRVLENDVQAHGNKCKGIGKIIGGKSHDNGTVFQVSTLTNNLESLKPEDWEISRQ